MTDFHTIRLNGPDYLLFLKAKVYLITREQEDLQNNDVFHIIITNYNAQMEAQIAVNNLPDIEKE